MRFQGYTASLRGVSGTIEATDVRRFAEAAFNQGWLALEIRESKNGREVAGIVGATATEQRKWWWAGTVCEHNTTEGASSSLHWSEDQLGNEYRIDCGCLCDACRSY